jgi:hypothetical protein
VPYCFSHRLKTVFRFCFLVRTLYFNIFRPYIIQDRGEIFTCGDNRYGKLGLSQKTFNSIQFTPTSVQKYQEIKVDNVMLLLKIKI